MIIDTGASIDILNETAYKKVNHGGQVALQPSIKRLLAYGSAAQLHVLGSFDTTLTVKNNQIASTLQVLEGSHGSLLSYSTAVDLGIFSIRFHHITGMPVHEQFLSSTQPCLKALVN